ncbi:hypothetical protein [Candidatus Accumulibacter sp. ACC007]|uniref:hypothetical protein n=1 Tax=Candidatus Accumulibacter sp. ACC007 TaxID=2823333 RepID=UPI0025C2AE2A|nr:hypothetical protein [Candidatus Accumulibacter sp. ACC007]
MDKLSQERLRFVLQSALLAPSADNHHRFRIQVRDHVIAIRGIETRLPPVGSYKRVLALVSLGAVAENLNIALSRFGLAGDALLLPDPAQANLLLRVVVNARGVAPDPLWKSIPERHTNRQVRFSGPAMNAAEHADLDSAVAAYPTSKLMWLDEAALRKRVLGLMRRAESERFRNPVLHEELFSAIRFDVGWRNNCLEGLPPGSLGVEAPLQPFFALLRHWSLARVLNLFGAHQMLGFRSCYLPCRMAPHLGLLAVSDADDSQSIFDSGRSFQRLWLAATGHGRVLQPMPAAALYTCRGARAEGIPATLQRDLADAWKGLLGGAAPVMLFRMGLARRSAIVSGRRPVDDYLELRQ